MLRALGETPPTELNTPERLVGRMGTMLADLPDDMAGRAAFAIGSQFARNGEWSMAAEAFLLMAEKYPAHPQTAEAYRWLIRHYASSEVRRRYELGNFVTVSSQQLGVKGAGLQAQSAPDAMVKPAVKYDVPQIVEEHAEGRNFSQIAAQQWYKGPLDLEKRLATFGPLSANDPGTQFCLQAARPPLGQVA